jgi:glutathione reductase (NADPH)
MMRDEADVLVIGAGTAGTHVARTAARAGLTVAVVDHAERIGGNCLWHGCVPKKALYVAAQTRLEAQRAARMGFSHAAPGVDWTRLMAWRLEAQNAYAGDQEGAMHELGIDVVHADARFVAPDTVRAGERLLTGKRIVVSTGSAPVLPDLPGIELADTSDDALHYPERPASLAIVGGGYIAMEFAGIYAAFDTEVTVLVRGEHVLRGFDPDAAALARQGLESLGVTFVTGAGVEAVEQRGLDLAVRLRDRPELTITRVLVATGRRANLASLDLAAGGVEVDERGKPKLDETLRSVSNPRVWIGGDATGGLELTPVATVEGEAIAKSVVDGEPTKPDLAVMPSACFTVPEVARVGLGEAELAARGRPYQVARGDVGSVAAAIIADHRGGLVKLLGDEDGRLVGAHLAGPHASELIYTFAVALRAGAHLTDFITTKAIHPTLAESLNWAAYSVETIVP